MTSFENAEIIDKSKKIIDVAENNHRMTLDYIWNNRPEKEAILSDFDKGINELYAKYDKADLDVQDIFDVSNESKIRKEAYQNLSSEEKLIMSEKHENWNSDEHLDSLRGANIIITQDDVQFHIKKQNEKALNQEKLSENNLANDYKNQNSVEKTEIAQPGRTYTGNIVSVDEDKTIQKTPTGKMIIHETENLPGIKEADTGGQLQIRYGEGGKGDITEKSNDLEIGKEKEISKHHQVENHQAEMGD